MWTEYIKELINLTEEISILKHSKLKCNPLKSDENVFIFSAIQSIYNLIRYRVQHLIILTFDKLNDSLKEKTANLNPYSVGGTPVLYALRHKQ